MMKSFEEFILNQPELYKRLRLARLMGSSDLTDRVNQRAIIEYQKYLELPEQPFNDEIPAEYVIGNIVIGKSAVFPDISIKADIAKLDGHILCTAATGSGKTHLTLWLLHQIQTQFPATPLRYIVFAPKRDCEQRNLIVNNKPGSALFIDKSSLSINPFSSIANETKEVVISEAALIISNELGLQVGGQLYLQKKMFEYTNQNQSTNFKDFVSWLDKKKETHFDLRGYHDRLMVRLTNLIFELGPIFNCYQGIPDKCFIENNIIIELPCSSTFMLSVVAGLILGRMFKFKGANPEYRRYKNLIVLEDIQGAMANA